ncbi:hypothetical protein [Acinetobacter sp. MD2(2019)]|uniref:hypothetical protein n=1 Tax=Acinetobacter sp. MD2(2019) TaxID=2605273 RepID=UPI002D1E6EF4|nr:hypothetical protein [Acinetobacter sp. MD2(2019)]MEB3754729.1 hypothetical protein [Acinetobacter sp. MD2(2019)]
MQDIPMSRWLSPLMAFCLSFMLMATLAPTVGIQLDRQIDFWLMWLASMLLLSLPIGYLEVALVRRSKTSALNAMLSLTRDADASPRWRMVSWLAVSFIPFLAGAILANASHVLQMNGLVLGSEAVLFLVACVIAIGASFIPRQWLTILLVLSVVVSMLLSHLFPLQLEAWHVTAVSFTEWGNATVLALVASGLGIGVYSQSSLSQLKQAERVSSVQIPVWIAQLLAVIAFGFFAVQTQVPALSMLVSAIFAAALLLQLAKEQLQQRQLAVLVQWIVLVLPLFIWAVTALLHWFNLALMLWGLFICLLYAIFAGWIMKISHLRKALNFSNELLYNLWRIAVRIVLPIAIILAIISIVLGQF